MTALVKPDSLEEAFEEATYGEQPGEGARSRAHVEYQRRPLDWMVEKLGIPRETVDWAVNAGYERHQWDGTPNPFRVALEGIANWQNVALESANGPGKTFLLGALVLWCLACWEGCTVVTGAPKEKQLELHAWKEIGKMWPRFKAMFPEAELTKLHIRMQPAREDWAAVGFVAGVSASEVSAAATRAQGFHAEHLFIFLEELTGIAPAVYNSFFNTCTAPHNLIWGQGNPDHQLDQLHRHALLPGTVHVRISAYDHPNVVLDNPNLVPGACSRKAIQDKINMFGEGSRLEASRNRGICPAEAAESLIKLEWVEAAMARWPDWMADRRFQKLPAALGADVANSENGDKACSAYGRGPLLMTLVAKQCPNANKYGRELWDTMQLEQIDPMHVGIDNVGVGSGAVNELDELTLKADQGVVFRFSGGAIENTQRMPDGSTYEWAPDANLFDTLRSQGYWQLREDLRRGEIALPPNASLKRQLTTPLYKTDGGKVHVEAKHELKKRLSGFSPDEMDSVVYWNWVRPRVAIPEPEPAPSRDAPLPHVPRRDDFEFTPREYDGEDPFNQLPAGF